MFQVYVISDATGVTAEQVVQAALTQFEGRSVEVTRFGGVRTSEQVCKIVEQAAANNGVIVHTLMSSELRQLTLTQGRRCGVATIDLMGPLLARLTELLATSPRSEPGLFRPFDDAYLGWIEALKFAVLHDDGRNTDELSQVDIVLVGVSRTFKTPLCIYLANQGWRAANVPLVLGVEPPANLFTLSKRRVIVLMVQPEWLAVLRGTRVERLGTKRQGYADLEFVRREVANAYELLGRRPDWPIIDMTAKPIEEAAAEIVNLVGRRSSG